VLIKIVNFKRKERRRPADLRRLFRYLLSPKLSRNPQKTPARLLGPPDLHHLVLTSLPWGAGINESADDLANQFHRYCRDACAYREFPEVWYVHIIFSFAPQSAQDLRTPPDRHGTPVKRASVAQNALRLSYDALDFLGWPDRQPSFFVVHGDRRHIHVHGVLALPFPSGEVWDALTTSRGQLNEIANICADAFGLKITKRAARAHQRRLDSMTEDSFFAEDD
jgi:hypothetical protein